MGVHWAVWHVLDFVAPAFVIGTLSAGLAKVAFRREMRNVAWHVLSAWAVTASLVALVAGAFWQGRDGTMATYAAMVLACATALWWRGLVRRR